MKLAKRLGIALILGVFLVLAGSAYIRFQREIALFDTDMRRDHTALGRALAVAVAQVWAAEGEEAAHALIRGVNATRTEMSLRWVSLRAHAAAPNRPALDREALAPLATAEVVHAIHPADAPAGSGEHERLYTYVVAPVPGQPQGAIEIGESLATKDAYLRSTMRNTLLASLSMALVCGLVAVAIGVYFVGRPVGKLIEEARRIGTGRLEERIDLPRRDELGELAVELDLMSRKLAEAKRKTESETAARIAALEQLRHAERLTTVGRMASALAHEVGTPLNVVAGHAQMIAKGRAPGGDPTESARVIVDQCERMTRLVRQILDYARRRPPKTLSADLRDVARGTVELLAPMARARGVDIQSDLELRAVAQVDASQVQQALINLIMNAVQATREGGRVEVALSETTAKRGDSRDARELPCYVLAVTDHGSGIRPESLGRLFEPFFTTKPSGEGTGLGLSIAHDIVQEHGGWIAVDSELGQGSRFELYFPVPTEPCQAESSSLTTTSPPAA